MTGYKFTEFIPDNEGKSTFDKLLDLFMQILVYTSGDVNEAFSWLNMLDREHNLTDDEYGMGDFIQDLKDKGYIDDDESGGATYILTPKSEQSIRRRSLEEIFGKLKKSKPGNHGTPYAGIGDEPTTDRRNFQFGDTLEQIAMTDSLRNAQIQHGIDDFKLTEDDLEVVENEYKAQTSTVLMIDISHSMILYGEDRITPAKKVAMAMDILRRRKNSNKQIFMITDGKPTCLKEGLHYYKNAFGLDRKIVNRTLKLASQCRRINILITTFMVARDPYLQQFVREFTKVNNGKAFYTNPTGLGEYLFEDYVRNRRRWMR